MNTAAAANADEFSSRHTANFPALLRQLRASVLVSTYQAGRLVVLRAADDQLNTHFRRFARPMGLAAANGKLALGAQGEILEFRNMPALAPRLSSTATHDAAYLLRRRHLTGAIDIHEMAYAADGALWFVNTLFSCLCTLDDAHSFVPRWRPRFVGAYAPGDRCHLNGLGLRDGRPRYVTALGETDTVQGWRANKRDGGVLIDLDADAVIARGLSMPHSPRWHAGRLWLLESGRGALVTVDPHCGERTDVARVPGFARGLDFVGPLALIGLSQLRESNAFTDIPLTDANADRRSGLWVVDTRNGETVAFLTFTGDVREIFAVQALVGQQFPDLLHDGELLETAYALPADALRETAAAVRA
ncbi:MAG TPA: TIGR03032 family protein [Tahibacter sp.]|nr:TIGR03032 family protein [Tahibacter sp.]HVH33460.1 TIGR03032 family protein [Tahibacter sp.]